MSSSSHKKQTPFYTSSEIIALVENAKNDDFEAFRKLFKFYKKSVFSLIRGVSTNLEDSQEILNDTMYKAWKSIHQLQEPSKFFSWLCQIARNKAYQFNKDRNKKQQKHEVYLEGIGLLMSSSENNQGIHHFHVRDEHEWIISILHKYAEEDDRIAYLMHYDAGDSIVEIAEALGITKKEVHARLKRVDVIIAAYTKQHTISVLAAGGGFNLSRFVDSALDKIYMSEHSLASVSDTPPEVPAAAVGLTATISSWVTYLLHLPFMLLGLMLTALAGLFACGVSSVKSAKTPQQKRWRVWNSFFWYNYIVFGQLSIIFIGSVLSHSLAVVYTPIAFTAYLIGLLSFLLRSAIINRRMKLAKYDESAYPYEKIYHLVTRGLLIDSTLLVIIFGWLIILSAISASSYYTGIVASAAGCLVLYHCFAYRQFHYLLESLNVGSCSSKEFTNENKSVFYALLTAFTVTLLPNMIHLFNNCTRPYYIIGETTAFVILWCCIVFWNRKSEKSRIERIIAMVILQLSYAFIYRFTWY